MMVLNFATKQSNGLIIWQGNKGSDFFNMGIKNGYLEIDISMGSGINLFVRSTSLVNTGTDQKIELSLFNENVTLSVNGRMEKEDENRPSKFFEFDSDDMYLGGGPTNILRQSGYTMGFQGCIIRLGVVHYKLPDKPVPPKWGSSNIKFSEVTILEQLNAKCTKMC